jgi:hypothetical protein
MQSYEVTVAAAAGNAPKTKTSPFPHPESCESRFNVNIVHS